VLLTRAARLVKPQGTLAYVTCSILAHENGKQIKAFLERNSSFSVIDAEERAAKVLSRPVSSSGTLNKLGLLLAPAQHGTDGFYIALLIKSAA
jgi:16S rRNA (cytosine967-C5)-methyltransferase